MILALIYILEIRYSYKIVSDVNYTDKDMFPLNLFLPFISDLKRHWNCAMYKFEKLKILSNLYHIINIIGKKLSIAFILVFVKEPIS